MKSLLIMACIMMVTLIFLQSPSTAISISDPEEALSNYDINISQNNSSIRFIEQRNVSSAPVIMNIGNGYYGSRPISYNSVAGSETWIKDTNAAASMHHEVNYAHGIDGEIELSGQGSSYYQDDYYSQKTGAIQMKVNEDVTEGMVHIGVLQGDSASVKGTGAGDGTDPLINAWKNPSLEMEEDYIGTYHIEKKMSITTSHNDAWKGDYWLDCCSGGYFNVDGYSRRLISADDVFDYRFVDA